MYFVEAEGGKMALLARMKDMEENDKAGFLEIQTLNAVIKTQDSHIRDITHKLVLIHNPNFMHAVFSALKKT